MANNPNYDPRTHKDYSHLEPPLALPSQEERPPHGDNLEAVEDTNSKEDYEEVADWLKEGYSNYQKDQEDSDPVDFEAPDPPLFIRRKKMDSEDSRAISEREINPKFRINFEGDEAISEGEKQPNPIYLPVDSKDDNMLYNSLVDMINVAETLRVKRPSGASPEYYTDNSEEDAEVISPNNSGKTSESLSRKDQMHPQVAKVQDRGVTDGFLSHEDWNFPKMEWDPADTPLATVVLGSVMLFLILCIVSVQEIILP